jgi:benzil reductase ((S)-benzoin forming)
MVRSFKRTRGRAMTSSNRSRETIEEAVVLTGASRGLGAALAHRLLSPRRTLLCVARTTNQDLVEQASRIGAPLEWFEQDLADVEATDALAAEIFARLKERVTEGRLRRIVLVNNAGLVEPIGLASQLDALHTAAALQVNLLAAMSFTARLLAATNTLSCERRILNISSGAARRPIAGWSAYCSSKAALDMYTRCVKLEQAELANPARLCSLAPGVIDTDMQAQIRSASTDRLPTVERYRGLKTSGSLATPEDTAQRILAYLERADFGEREIDDLRNG